MADMDEKMTDRERLELKLPSGYGPRCTACNGSGDFETGNHSSVCLQRHIAHLKRERELDLAQLRKQAIDLSGLEAGREGMRAEIEEAHSVLDGDASKIIRNEKDADWKRWFEGKEKELSALRTQLKEQAEQLEALADVVRKYQAAVEVGMDTKVRIETWWNVYAEGKFALDSINRGKAS